jgi:hypothetical protein
MTFTLRPHQEKLATDVLADLRRGDPEVLLAGCPGFGKTETAIEIISRLLAEGAVKRVLVLAHGLTVLRSNFVDRIQKRRPELLESSAVVVALPQEGARIRGSFDLVVVDEAHEFYGIPRGMVAKIIKRVGARRFLLLTGTPAPFIRRGLKAHTFALLELYQAGFASDVRVELVTSAYSITEKDWNADGEVRVSITYRGGPTAETVDRVLKRLGGSDGVAAAKTIIACRNRQMAASVSRALTRRRVDHLVSEHEEDPGSANVLAFTSGRCPVLVVVRRTQLGFDMPALENFVDMTGSRNPDRIFQMLCRVVRKPDGMALSKVFVKAMPEAFSGVPLRYFMTGVLNLADPVIFAEWDGGSFWQLKVKRVPLCQSVMGCGEEAVQGRRACRDHLESELHPLRPSGRDAIIREPFDSGMMMFGDLFSGASEGDVSVTLAQIYNRVERSARNPQARKAEIIAFFRRTGNWPKNHSHDESERRLRISLTGYTCVTSDTFDPAFLRRIKRLGWRRRSLRTSMLIDGKEVALVEAARKAGITTATLRVRLKAGMGVSSVLSPLKKPKTIVVGGIKRTIREWARIKGISESAIYRKLRRGVMGDELFRNARDLTVTHEGRRVSLAALAKESGISKSAIYGRHAKGLRGRLLVLPAHQGKRIARS